MKKISIAIVVLVTFVISAACGGSSWSEADKAELKTGLNIGVGMDVLTQKQADCMSSWLQNRYDSLEAANADEENKAAQKDLMSDCDLSSEYFNENEEVEIDEPLVIEREVTTTTTYNNTDAQIESLCNEAISNIETGLGHISDGVTSLPYVDVATANEFISAGIDFVAESLNTVELCADVMPEITVLEEPLEDLRTSMIDAIQ